MATDWLVYWMTRPAGLALIALAVAFPFAIWRIFLGRSFSRVGFAPLAAGYALSGIGLYLGSMAWSCIEFSSRVRSGALAETERWSIVPGWSVYFSVLSLIGVLPMLGLLGVPASAWLTRRHCLNHKSIAMALGILWVVLALVAWSIPSNEWHQTHRLQSLGTWLSTVGVSVFTVGLPFLYGIYFIARRRIATEA
jgi:hypothetical protein